MNVTYVVIVLMVAVVSSCVAMVKTMRGETHTWPYWAALLAPSAFILGSLLALI